MCGHGPWGGYGMMRSQMPWGMGLGFGYIMRCPACGEPLMKPSKEEILEMLERRKKWLEGVLDHINMKITRLKENKPEQ